MCVIAGGYFQLTRSLLEWHSTPRSLAGDLEIPWESSLASNEATSKKVHFPFNILDSVLLGYAPNLTYCSLSKFADGGIRQEEAFENIY